jgi:cysteinyl-tRNA synthetase
MIAIYERDTSALGLGRPDSEPKASKTIGPIVNLIGALIESDHAYVAGRDVYFRVASYPDYGKLSNRALEEMDQGEDDVATDAVKESPHDFALWKGHKEGEDTAWDAPWGRGRPGWHIECSAMAEEVLGLDFEIHGGGSDLIFPHHENEIAQTEAARGEPLARIWMHNGMVRLEQEKMSKSVGNIHLLGEALREYGRDALIAYFVQGHYRQPIAFSAEALEQASRAVERIRDFGRRLAPDGAPPEGLDPFEQRFYAALADDFNTPAALAVVFEWIAEGNRRLDAGERFGPGALSGMLWTLGLDPVLEADAEAPDAGAERLLEERQAARADRDFERADAKRDELLALGWAVRDTPDGPQLVRKG